MREAPTVPVAMLFGPTPRIEGRRCSGDDQGVALIAVLWGITLLALIAVVFSSSVQIEMRSAAYQREAVQAYGIACGGVEAALFEIGYPARPDQKKPLLWNWQDGQRVTVVPFPGGRAVLEIVNETGKLDLNVASREELTRLFEARGVGEENSQRLAASILHWRSPKGSDDASQDLDEVYRQAGYLPRHNRFGSVEEVLRVRGMTPDIYYGTLAATRDGRLRRMYGVSEDFTVFSQTVPININYASLTALESVPGLDRDTARAVVEERANRPFASIPDANLRLAGALTGDSLPFLTAAKGSFYTIVSVGEVTGSRVRRAVRAVVSMAGDGSASPRIVLWYDEDLLHGVG